MVEGLQRYSPCCPVFIFSTAFESGSSAKYTNMTKETEDVHNKSVGGRWCEGLGERTDGGCCRCRRAAVGKPGVRIDEIRMSLWSFFKNPVSLTHEKMYSEHKPDITSCIFVCSDVWPFTGCELPFIGKGVTPVDISLSSCLTVDAGGCVTCDATRSLTDTDIGLETWKEHNEARNLTIASNTPQRVSLIDSALSSQSSPASS